MPTRYALDVELKSIVTGDVVSGANPTTRQNARKDVKKIFEEKYAAAAIPTRDRKAASRSRQYGGRSAGTVAAAACVWRRARWLLHRRLALPDDRLVETSIARPAVTAAAALVAHCC